MSLTKFKGEIRAILILEILGRPKEYLIESLNTIIDKMGSEKGVKIEHKKINEPHLVEGQKDLYTTYAEVEVKVDEQFMLVMLVFKYMPSHIEMISPEEFIFKNSEYNDMLNEVTRRLHGYDELAKILQFKNSALENQLKDILTKHPEILEELKQQTSENKEVKNSDKKEKKKKK
jgi:hypothetical protein